jgi:hypothetical protein
MVKSKKQKMIETVKEVCGAYSIAYMNIQQYSNAEDYQVTIIYRSIMQSTLANLRIDRQETEKKLQELDAQIQKVQKYLEKYLE